MRRGMGVAALSCAAAFWVCGTYPHNTAAVGDAQAGRAMATITSATSGSPVSTLDPPGHSADRLMPANYAAVMGYHAQTATGPQGVTMVIKPTGDCSSFTGSTRFDFLSVCKEHDLAYDVLRYAQRIGNPLPASARQAADNMFSRDLHARCDQVAPSGGDSLLCHTYAESFAQAVKVNSLRQGYGSPEPESPWRWTAMFLLAAALVGIPAHWRWLARRQQRNPWLTTRFVPHTGMVAAGLAATGSTSRSAPNPIPVGSR